LVSGAAEFRSTKQACRDGLRRFQGLVRGHGAENQRAPVRERRRIGHRVDAVRGRMVAHRGARRRLVQQQIEGGQLERGMRDTQVRGEALTYFAKPQQSDTRRFHALDSGLHDQYMRVGLSTRMRLRTAGSGHISPNKSTSAPSFGMSFVMFG
jgi:hypothetical protein